MARYYQMPYNNITQVEMNDKTFSLIEGDRQLMCLPKSVLSGMIMHHENILLDLEDESKPAKKYWSDGDTAIYTKDVMELIGPKYVETVVRKLLCIWKAPVDVVLDAKMFRKIVLKAAILSRIQKDDCILSRVGPKYDLNSTNCIIFHPSGKVSICDEVAPNQFEFSFEGLLYLIRKRKEILADLDSQFSAEESIHWIDDHGLSFRTITSEKSRIFCFWLEGIVEAVEAWVQDEISINKNTFDLMLHIALGAPMWKEGMNEDEKIRKARMLYWDSTPFNIVKKIDFSADLQKFTISNDTYGVTLAMPSAALKAALDRKVQILSDLESEKAPANREKDYINEYWTDQTYSIRTGELCNLFREIDCKVVRFVKVKDNECVFVAHKEAFLKLLETYQCRRRNSKKR